MRFRFSGDVPTDEVRRACSPFPDTLELSCSRTSQGLSFILSRPDSDRIFIIAQERWDAGGLVEMLRKAVRILEPEASPPDFLTLRSGDLERQGLTAAQIEQKLEEQPAPPSHQEIPRTPLILIREGRIQ